MKARACLGLLFVVSLAVGCSDEAMENGKTVSEWAALTEAIDGQTRLNALTSLGLIGPDAQSAVPKVAARLRDPIEQIAWVATQALGSMGPRGIDALVTALEDKDTLVRGRVASILAMVGPAAKAAAPRLRQLLDAEIEASAQVRFLVAGALAAVAPDDPTPVATLIAGLDPRADRQTTTNAAQALAKLGPRAAPAVPHLAPYLGGLAPAGEAVRQALVAIGSAGVPALLEFADRTDSEDACLHAVKVVGEIGAGDLDTANRLLVLCEHFELEIRRAAIVALGEVDVGSDKVLGRLRREVVKPGEGAQVEAVEALSKLASWKGAWRGELLEAIPWDGDVEDRRRLGGALAAFGSDVLEDLLNAVEKTELERRRAALLDAVLGAVKKEPSWEPRAVPVLLAGLEHESELIMNTAAAALQLLPGFDVRLAPALAKLVTAEPPARRWAASEALHTKVTVATFSHDGESSDAANTFLATVRAQESALRPALSPVLDSHQLRIEIVLALTAKDGAELVPRLAERLEKDKIPAQREQAGIALMLLGPKAAPAVPALLRILQDTEQPRSVREQAGHALIGIGAPAVEPIGKELEKPDQPMLQALLQIVRGIGLAAAPLLPKVRPLLQHPNIGVQQQAIRAIGKMGEAARTAVPDLVKAASGMHGSTTVQAFADLGPVAIEAAPLVFRSLQRATQPSWGTLIGVLAGMGPGVVPIVIEGLESAPWRQIGFAMLVLDRMDAEAAAAVPTLLALLQHENSAVRIGAARVLGGIGGDPERIGAALAAGLRDSVGRVRAECADALGLLGSKARGHLQALDGVAANDEFKFVRDAATEARTKIHEAKT